MDTIQLRSHSPRRWTAYARAVTVAILAALALLEARAMAPTGILYDFGSFWASGDALRHGLDPYGVYPLTFIATQDGHPQPSPNLDPPVLLPLFAAFSLVDPQIDFGLWWALSLLCYAVACWLLLRRTSQLRDPLTLTWLASSFALWGAVYNGQIYTQLLLLSVGAWLALRSQRSVLAGVLLGTLVAAKPNFAVWPMALFLAGSTMPALMAGATFLVLWAMPALLYSPIVYQEWLTVALGTDSFGGANGGTVFSLGRLIGHPEMTRTLGIPSAALLLAALAVWCLRRRGDALTVSALALVVSLLASPVA